jgi:hypothetical protein
MLNLVDVKLLAMNATDDEAHAVESGLEAGGSKAWKVVKVTWTAIRALIYVVLVLLTLEKMDGAFQIVVCSLLILILNEITAQFGISSRAFAEESFIHRSLFAGILKRLGDPESDEGLELLRGLAADYNRTTVHWYINSVASYIVYLIVLWKIISVVVL